MSQHYFSPKLTVFSMPEKGGKGVRAQAPIGRGELLAVWGGAIVPTAAFEALPRPERNLMIQVEEGLFLTAANPPEPSEFFNHSCSPNAGILGQISLVAMAPIAPDDEVCYDYAMTDCHPLFDFDCACGSPLCRGRMSGQDWLRPDLQQRYRGYFSSYLERRIAQTSASVSSQLARKSRRLRSMGD